MSLANYQPQRRYIALGENQGFHVQGLDFESLAVLVQTHMPDLDAVYELFKQVDQLDENGIKTLAVTMVSNAPGLSANVIALASGETDAVNGAVRLPFPVQVDALLMIGELTFTEVGGVKKFMEVVAALLTKVTSQPLIPTTMLTEMRAK